jgi:hypothetical protein
MGSSTSLWNGISQRSNSSQHVIRSMSQIAAWTVGGTMFIAFTWVEPLLSCAHAL